MEKFLIFLLIVGLASCSPTNSDNKDKTIDYKSVKIESGLISGKTTDNQDLNIFMGIPFAAPPVNELRWKAPQPVQPWKGVLECVTAPASAMQATPTPFLCWSVEFLAPVKLIGEDCLYLNVWSSAKRTDEKLPVIVWIHGGGFSGGSGTVPLYDGEDMARKGVVFVTINYRLGVFGFLNHPELVEESEYKTVGNYGILDQIAALKWVNNNIAEFGGDSGNITINGQSAGSFSVNALVASPLAKGLFQKAIAQSGGMFGKNTSIEEVVQQAQGTGVEFLKTAGVTSIEELRRIPANELIKIPGRFGPTIDGIVIPPIYETFVEGKQNDVALITGWNKDDGVSFGPPPSTDIYKENAQKQYGDNANKFLSVFPGNTAGKLLLTI